MGEQINKEFEEFQKQLLIRSKKIKGVVHFDQQNDIDEILKEVKSKKIDVK